MMQPDFDSEDVFDLLRNLDFRNLKAEFVPYQLQFRRPGKTSRGTMTHRDIWLLKVYEKDFPELAGLGEVAPLPGLSIETAQQVEDALIDLCVGIKDYNDFLSGKLERIPSVQFALEQALLDLKNNGDRILFPTKFTNGLELIRTNGLIWMGEPDYMIEQINEKVQGGFKCLKLKIGALNFDVELKIIEQIREVFGYHELEIRLDANGAFHAEDALDMLDQLAPYGIHSIEQPIKAGLWDEMNELCHNSPIPVALDEECIGAITKEDKEDLLDQINPAFIILKPSLLGGFQQCEEWIELADQRDIHWWVTSALESNLGLNAIAQWTFTKQNPIHQGLGTGQLFTNNFDSPLYLDTENLMYDPAQPWKLNF
jgi:O-succinylbenzoate synthase